MPQFGKSVLSQFLRSGCRRQLRFSLSPDNNTFRTERERLGMPQPQAPRPGLAEVKAAGDEWERVKIDELFRAFNDANGAGPVRGNHSHWPDGRWRCDKVDLADLLTRAEPGDILVQASLRASQGAFSRAVGLENLRQDFGLEVQSVQPDLIQVLPPGAPRLTDGSPVSRAPRRVLPSGVTAPIHPEDKRLRLRPIEIKMTTEANSGYFAEVAYYNMALAGFLEDCAVSPDRRVAVLARRFIVTDDCAVWPGSHDASALTRLMHATASLGIGRPDHSAALGALESEFEAGPFEVFAQRIRRLVRQDVPGVLAADWRQLAWHVDGRCRGCDYLGHEWPTLKGERTVTDGHCMPEAALTHHLSNVAFLPRGASEALFRAGVKDIRDLASIDVADPVLSGHQALRTSRTLLVQRAKVLSGSAAGGVVEGTGMADVMPRFANLRINVVASSDPGTRLTFAFGLNANWIEATTFGDMRRWPDVDTKRWQHQTFVVDTRRPETERREFIAFLSAIQDILSEREIREKDRANGTKSTYQIYIWDHATYEHLRRVASRHLDEVLRRFGSARLAWLFPAADLVADPASATRESPVTVVQEVVRRTLALPLPHHYSLLSVARVYHPAALDASGGAEFRVPRFFEDPLADQIPPERIHEIWSRSSDPGWTRRLVEMDRTVDRQLSALDAVVRRLSADLRDRLTGAAPEIPGKTEAGEDILGVGTNTDSRLWMAYEMLNSAVAKGDIEGVRAMPLDEREARFKSARLTCRLEGDEALRELKRLNEDPARGRRVYRLAETSTEVSMRDGDVGWALAPASNPVFLSRTPKQLGADPALVSEIGRGTMERATSVKIVRIDRVHRIVVVDPGDKDGDILDRIEKTGLADLSRDVVLDPVHIEVFGAKLRRVLRQIGNPMIARQSSLVARATGAPPSQSELATGHVSPVAQVLWGAEAMLTASERDVPQILDDLRRNAQGKLPLNDWQRVVLTKCVQNQLVLMWGPPGTGKSHTLTYVEAAFLKVAERRGRRCRILITSHTWGAIDGLLGGLQAEAAKIVDKPIRFARLRSSAGREPPERFRDIDVLVSALAPGQDATMLKADLLAKNGAASTGLYVVGATAHQVHNLVRMGAMERNLEELFDVIIIDEGSQMDVPHAIVALSALARGGTVICAGDPLQLAPIHPAEEPEGLGGMVGSIYEFFAKVHGITAYPLAKNYRSNAEIVNFFKRAGYPENLHANSPGLRIRLEPRLPDMRPDGWPRTLAWTPEWREILDPDRPLTCLVHPDGKSSQWNEFEAQATASMVWLLWRHLRKGMANQLDYDCHPIPYEDAPHTPKSFWGKAVGIVTPHRAQQGLVVKWLTSLFPEAEGHDPAMIRAAVDTVERFQGQERDVIIATYAIGDPDMVSSEDGFLMSLNRFNVLASRARAKLIVIMSEEVVEHVPSDVDTLLESRLLKDYAESACPERRQVLLPWMPPYGDVERIEVSSRWLQARAGEIVDEVAEQPPDLPSADDSGKGQTDGGALASLGSDVFDVFA